MTVVIMKDLDSEARCTSGRSFRPAFVSFSFCPGIICLGRISQLYVENDIDLEHRIHGSLFSYSAFGGAPPSTSVG